MDNKKNSWHYTIGERRELDTAKQRQKVSKLNADFFMSIIIGVAIALGVAVIFAMCGLATAALFYS